MEEGGDSRTLQAYSARSQGRKESGVPLGGIGAGKIEFCADGRFTNVTTTNNWDCPIIDGSARTPLMPRFQACLGLEINAPEGQVYFTRPHLPASLGELRIHNLEVAGAAVDLLLVRHEHDVGINVLRRKGDIEILVVK